MDILDPLHAQAAADARRIGRCVFQISLETWNFEGRFIGTSGKNGGTSRRDYDNGARAKLFNHRADNKFKAASMTGADAMRYQALRYCLYLIHQSFPPILRRSSL